MHNLTVRNPYDGSTVCELPYDSLESVGEKTCKAMGAFAVWRNVPVAERVDLVRRGLQYFEPHADAVAEDITRQMGKPLQQSRNEIGGLFERANFMCDIAAEALRPDVLPAKEGFLRRIEHEPVGVVLDIAAWNYPLVIAVNVVVPALLSGNAVLIKHSSRTPLCGLHFERAFGTLGEFGPLVQNVVLSHDDVETLLGRPGFGYVSFTGSVAGGAAIYHAASRRFIDVGLELGGKDAAYVAEDADLSFAVENIIDGACYNAGQSCCGIERAYVHEAHYESFLERAARLMEAYVPGDPLADGTTLGPMASTSGVRTVLQQVEEAKTRGARILTGGTSLDLGIGQFVAPTLVADAAPDMQVMREENFGPVLAVARVRDDDEALRLMNDNPYGLTASVWTADVQRAERVARDLSVGTVFMNRCDYLDPALPWTGVKDSGKGTSLSKYGFYALTRRKSIHFRLNTG